MVSAPASKSRTKSDRGIEPTTDVGNNNLFMDPLASIFAPTRNPVAYPLRDNSREYPHGTWSRQPQSCPGGDGSSRLSRRRAIREKAARQNDRGSSGNVLSTEKPRRP